MIFELQKEVNTAFVGPNFGCLHDFSISIMAECIPTGGPWLEDTGRWWRQVGLLWPDICGYPSSTGLAGMPYRTCTDTGMLDILVCETG